MPAWRTPEPADVAEDLRDVEGVDFRDSFQGVALLVNHHRHVGVGISQSRPHLASNMISRLIATRRNGGRWREIDGCALARKLTRSWA